MKKQSVENKINLSLNSKMPSMSVMGEAKEYMRKNISTKKTSKKFFKLSLAAVSSICIIIASIIILPLLINGSNIEDARLIETKYIEERDFSSIKDYNKHNLLSVKLEGEKCNKYIFKKTNRVLYIMESFIVPLDINASKIEEIVVMKEYNNKIIQSIEDYMYLDNSYILNERTIMYEEIFSSSFCLSFEFEGYIYYIIIYDTDIMTAKTLIEEMLNF